MVTPVVVPSLGNEITEGVVVELLKKPGDHIQAGETIVVIETPKLNMEVEAPVSGMVAVVAVKQDDVVEVGATLATIDET